MTERHTNGLGMLSLFFIFASFACAFWPSPAPTELADADWTKVVERRDVGWFYVPSVWESHPRQGVVCYLVVGGFSDDLECVLIEVPNEQ